ncbi:hypothetical protein [Streptomyces similanensis]|uniref:Metal-dependent phosphohydrolase n=1 Tax=Streptomyces similanensis TaxID=1274988 RepID=A0ABP9K8N0_9ACTN
MELRSVEELMDLLYACRGATVAPAGRGRPADVHDHALRTAALLRRRHPADKELQVAGLVQGIGRLLGPGPGAGPGDRAADAVRPLLGARVARLVRAGAGGGADEDAAALRRAAEEALTDEGDAGVLEDWRTLLALVADRASRLRAAD